MHIPEPIPTAIHDESFAGVTYHVRGELVPELQVEIASQAVMFEHHVLLWKEPAVNIELRKLPGGIKRKIAPPAAIEGDAYARGELPELPGSLESAIQAFESDHVLREALDERFSDYFVTSRAWEVKAFRATVTDWERDRYMRTV